LFVRFLGYSQRVSEAIVLRKQEYRFTHTFG
jgi:hypothetical protein